MMSEGAAHLRFGRSHPVHACPYLSPMLSVARTSVCTLALVISCSQSLVPIQHHRVRFLFLSLSSLLDCLPSYEPVIVVPR